MADCIMKNLPELAIRYRTITLFITTLLMAWGMIAYVSMPRREDPEFTIRTCVVATRWAKLELFVLVISQFLLDIGRRKRN